MTSPQRLGPHIPVAAKDRTGWCGRPVRVCGKCGSGNIRVDCSLCGDSTFDHECNDGCRDCGGPEIRAFDVTDAAHRDHLIRRYALPQWHRDTPGGLTPEHSAAVVLGSVLRVRAAMAPILSLVDSTAHARPRHEAGVWWGRRLGGLYLCVTLERRRWVLEGERVHRRRRLYADGPETGVAWVAAADAAFAGIGGARITPAGILLPAVKASGGPVLWGAP